MNKYRYYARVKGDVNTEICMYVYTRHIIQDNFYGLCYHLLYIQRN